MSLFTSDIYFLRRQSVKTISLQFGLPELASPLAKAGLSRINVSLDTLSRERFKTLTYRDKFEDVILGLNAAKEAGLFPIKVNSVLLKGINDDEAPALLSWALENEYSLRFIEQMPLDAGGITHAHIFVEMAQLRTLVVHLVQLL